MAFLGDSVRTNFHHWPIFYQKGSAATSYCGIHWYWGCTGTKNTEVTMNTQIYILNNNVSLVCAKLFRTGAFLFFGLGSVLVYLSIVFRTFRKENDLKNKRIKGTDSGKWTQIWTRCEMNLHLYCMTLGTNTVLHRRNFFCRIIFKILTHPHLPFLYRRRTSISQKLPFISTSIVFCRACFSRFLKLNSTIFTQLSSRRFRWRIINGINPYSRFHDSLAHSFASPSHAKLYIWRRYKPSYLSCKKTMDP